MRAHTQANSSYSSSDNGSRTASRQERWIANLFCTSHKYSCKLFRHSRQGKSPICSARATSTRTKLFRNSRQGKSPRHSRQDTVAKAQSPRHNDYTTRAITIEWYHTTIQKIHIIRTMHTMQLHKTKKGVWRDDWLSNPQEHSYNTRVRRSWFHSPWILSAFMCTQPLFPQRGHHAMG